MLIEAVVIDNGKYEVHLIDNGKEFKAIRNGENWRNLAGDELALEMFYRIQKLEGKLTRVYEEALNNGCSRDKIIDYINEDI